MIPVPWAWLRCCVKPRLPHFLSPTGQGGMWGAELGRGRNAGLQDLFKDLAPSIGTDTGMTLGKPPSATSSQFLLSPVQWGRSSEQTLLEAM